MSPSYFDHLFHGDRSIIWYQLFKGHGITMGYTYEGCLREHFCLLVAISSRNHRTSLDQGILYIEVLGHINQNKHARVEKSSFSTRESRLIFLSPNFQIWGPHPRPRPLEYLCLAKRARDCPSPDWREKKRIPLWENPFHDSRSWLGQKYWSVKTVKKYIYWSPKVPPSEEVQTAHENQK